MAQDFASLFIKVDSRGVVTASKDLAGLEQAGKRVEAGVGGMARVTTSATESMKRDWAALAIKVTAAYMAINQAMVFIKQGAMALQAEESFYTVGKSMGYAVWEMNKYRDALKRVAAGTVDDSDAMQKAVKGMVLGFNPDQIVKMMEAARVAARYTGQDVKTAYEGIVDAISTGMTRSLKQYGLLTTQQISLVNKATAAGITDINFYTMAMANSEDRMASFGNMSVTAAENYQQFMVSISESKEWLGKELIASLQGVYDELRLIAAASMQIVAGYAYIRAVKKEAAADFMGINPGQSPIMDRRAGELKKEAADAWLWANTARDTAKGLFDDVFKINAELASSDAGAAAGAKDAAQAEEDRINAMLDGAKKEEAAIKSRMDAEAEWLTAKRAASSEIFKMEQEYIKVLELAAEKLKVKTDAEKVARLEEIERNRLREEWIRNEDLAARGFMPEEPAGITPAAAEETTKSLDDMGRAIQELGGLVADFNTGLGRTVYSLGNVITQIQMFNQGGGAASFLSMAGSAVSVIDSLVKMSMGSLSKPWEPIKFDRGTYGIATGNVKFVDAMLRDIDRTIKLSFGKDNLEQIQRGISLLGTEIDTMKIYASRMKENSTERINLEEKIWNLEDQRIQYQQKQLQIYQDDLRAAFGAEKQRLTDLYHAELIVMNERLSATQQIIADLTSGVEKLRAASEKMFPMTMAEAQTSLAVILGQARQGNFSGLKGIDQALNTATGISESSYATRVDYLRDFQKNARMISELEKLTSGQLTTEEKMVAAIEKQITDAEKNFNIEIGRMDAQLNALLGIDTSVMSVADAIKQLTDIIKTYPKGGTPGTPYIPDTTIPTGGLTYGTPSAPFVEPPRYTNPPVGDPYEEAEAVQDIIDQALALVNYGTLRGKTPSEMAAMGAYIQSTIPDEGTPEWDEWYRKRMGYASGGYHPGGIRVVGERGPELEFTGPSRIFSNQQSKALVDNTELIAEIKALRAEVEELKKSNSEINKTLKTVTRGGRAMQTEVFT